jgi:hypothetical protein
MKNFRKYLIFILLSTMAGSCVAVYIQSKSENGNDHLFCVDPKPAKEAECKNIQTFHAPHGYIDRPRVGYDRFAEDVEIKFLYPSMRPLTDVEKLPHQQHSDEMEMSVKVRYLSQPFGDWLFDFFTKLFYHEKKIKSEENIYGLRLYSELVDKDAFPWQKYVLANGDKSTMVQCFLPWRGVNGRMFEDVECKIESRVDDHYLLEYSIKRKYLSQWEDVNDQTRKLVQSFIAH